jgi:hypothetical protein
LFNLLDITLGDWVGFAGVTILLLAFLLNLLKKITSESLLYILLNMIGAGLACLASWMIGYIPFVILEASWVAVSIVGLIRYINKTGGY